MKQSVLKKAVALVAVLSFVLACAIFPAGGRNTVYAATLTISTQPKNVTAKPGNTVKFTVKATGNGTVKYQWYYKKLDDTDWQKWNGKVYSSTSGTVNQTWNMMKVRCKVSDKSTSKYSKTVTVTVDQPLSIVAQPQGFTGKVGDPASFTVKAYGKGTVKYQWYFKKLYDADWSVWKGHTTATTTAKVNPTWNLIQMRCLVTDANGSKYSDTAVVTVDQPLSINTHPQDLTIKLNKLATFKCVAYGSGEMKYQWYYMKKGESGWSVWNGQTTPTITATSNESWKMMKIKCRVTDVSGSIESNPATIIIDEPLVILTQPQDTVSKVGKTTSFTVKAQGTGDLKYQWYYKKEGAKSWTLWSGYTSATASGTSNSTWDGMLVYCKITDMLGRSVNSQSAMALLSGKLRVTRQPEGVTLHTGDTATFKVKAYSENALTYQWYYKKAGKSSWTLWSGKTSPEMTATADCTWHGMQVYCKVTDSKKNTVDSNPAYTMITKQGSKRYFKRTITISANYTKVYDGVGTKYNVVAKLMRGKSFEALEWAADGNDTTWYRFSYNGRNVWVPRTSVTVTDDYTTIPDRKFNSGGIPVIYISPSKQPDNAFAYGGTTEQEQMYRVGNALKKILDEEYYCMTFIPSTALPLGLKNRAYDAYIRDADVYLAIHSNAISSKTVYGAIGYYSPNCNQGKVLSENIIAEMKKISIKKPTVTNQLREGMSAFGGTGYGEVRDPTYYGIVGVLAEVEYHDNKDSAKWIINNTDKIARALANSLEKTFGLQKKA
ncbi:MAG: N-acetylmuramoyl-L-alanine amidase [Clostridia bacterium]|nr:N-acetylmuramoyl-L-alanine amidase [Clostridia bacterium]